MDKIIEFQFTHPRGVRFLDGVALGTSTVSIHAPARGAMTAFRLSMIPSSFNSRTREGCDPIPHETCAEMQVSIHAPARGAMTTFQSAKVNHSFNSRTREGCDSGVLAIKTDNEFQFTHPRGVRYTAVSELCGKTVSIHAPARGAIRPARICQTRGSFNSRTREGCDSCAVCQVVPIAVSIHAPARGAINVL